MKIRITQPGSPPRIATLRMTQGLTGPAGSSGSAQISTDPDNRLRTGSDNQLYVPDDLIPDPLAYYILAKN